ncbi:TetR/AcrR family transcriptional regulator [Dyella mobilis]|uniref:TetR/AcrR family transcriptional regulator n=1 Tax=Dyella mobilis TaxID=1849582 RepID=A0ABS2KM34_9GAMM|nr:TetR/AcrR family transcriptional regulator [Dyella mobilis]MBM7132211.1 TetR/AcrR family transcriptional regulator [Dyella mobilis]GLQ95803.1 TetR family transcriptional regulator [Dyella mobilis]
MVQKEAKKPRGRPRAYDPAQALAGAQETFWRQGYSATSLDDLSEATGMNRPSLYAAFGDKRALYLAAMDDYVAAAQHAMGETLSSDAPLEQALLQVCDLALGLYFPAQGGARGCFLIGTSLAEAMNDDEVREKLHAALTGFDDAFEARFKRARKQGEIAANTKPAVLAKLASAIIHTLALRSRTGDTRASLRATAVAGIKMICAAS